MEYFTLEDNTLTLTLRGQNGEKSARLIYRVADPAVFYADMRELIDQQLTSGVLAGYDYPPAPRNRSRRWTENAPQPPRPPPWR